MIGVTTKRPVVRILAGLIGTPAHDLNAPTASIRKHEAALCSDCEAIFFLRRGECPRCASRTFEGLAARLEHRATK